MMRTKERLDRILAENTDRDAAQVTADCERDYFMSSEKTVDYGLIDAVIRSR